MSHIPVSTYEKTKEFPLNAAERLKSHYHYCRRPCRSRTVPLRASKSYRDIHKRTKEKVIRYGTVYWILARLSYDQTFFTNKFYDLTSFANVVTWSLILRCSLACGNHTVCKLRTTQTYGSRVTSGGAFDGVLGNRRWRKVASSCSANTEKSSPRIFGLWNKESEIARDAMLYDRWKEILPLRRDAGRIGVDQSGNWLEFASFVRLIENSVRYRKTGSQLVMSASRLFSICAMRYKQLQLYRTRLQKLANWLDSAIDIQALG